MDGNEDRIGEGGKEAKKRKKPHKSCRSDVGNGVDFGGKGKNVDKKGLVRVVANPGNLENSKKAEGETRRTHGLNKNCASKVCPFCRV